MNRTSDLVAYLADPAVIDDLARQLQAQRIADNTTIPTVTEESEQ